MPTNIFNFTDAWYTPPDITGGIYNFTSEKGVLYQLHSDEYLTYAATNLGCSIYDLSSGLLYANITRVGGFTSVVGDSTNIYLGTPNEGIKYFTTSSISGSLNNPIDLTSHVQNLFLPNLTSSGVRYMHLNQSNLSVCTTSGVDYVMLYNNPRYHSKSYIQNTHKCFSTSNSIGTTYYTVSGTAVSGTHSLNRIDYCLTDWSEPSMTYTTGSGIFAAGLKLTDMYITEGTAALGGNTVFCTTSSGVYVLDEDTQQYAIYYTGQ